MYAGASLRVADCFTAAGGTTSGGTGVGDTVVNQLLSKIDGVNSLNNILIIGMTNRSIPGLNNTLCLSPALIATADDIDHITGAIDKALTKVFG